MTSERTQRLLDDLQRLGPRLKARGRSEELTRMLDCLLKPTPMMSRSNFSPGHFTASAFVLSPDRKKLLLILHKKLGLWLQPGGHIEPTDASWQAAAAREVEEETGLRELEVLDELVDIDIHAIPAIGPEPAHLHFDLRTLFCARTLSAQTGAEQLQTRWFEVAALAFRRGRILADGVGSDESVARVARATLLLERVSR